MLARFVKFDALLYFTLEWTFKITVLHEELTKCTRINKRQTTN